jgi:large subunit ribosomal protein L17
MNRTQSHRKWLLSNLITSLFLHERIRTTVAKAKEARPLAEKLITFAKRGDLHARRHVLRFIHDKEVVKKLFEKLGERFRERPGGYTRIVRIGNRLGDNAPMAFLELMPAEAAKKTGAKKRRRRGKKKEAEPAVKDQEVIEAEGGEEAAVETGEEPEQAEASDQGEKKAKKSKKAAAEKPEKKGKKAEK